MNRLQKACNLQQKQQSGPHRSYLESEQQAYRFKALLAAINVVPEEQIVGFWRVASILEEADQVRILPVDVA